MILTPVLNILVLLASIIIKIAVFTAQKDAFSVMQVQQIVSVVIWVIL